MAESLVNSIARLRVIEKRLLTREHMARLTASQSYEEALRLLREAGYGQAKAETEARAAGAEDDELERMIASELAAAYATVDELMPARNRDITDAFRMRHDVINIKMLYKMRLLGQDMESVPLDAGGIYDGAKLRAAITSGDYGFMPKQLKNELERLDVATYYHADPKEVSVAIDNAYAEYGRAHSNAFVRKYFRALADFNNILIIIRGGADGFMPEGDITHAELKAMTGVFAEDPARLTDKIADALTQSHARKAVRGAYELFLKEGNAAAFEGARDEYLIKLASEGKTDIDSPAPIVGYMLAKEREADVVRLILTAKRSEIPMNTVKERGVELYG